MAEAQTAEAPIAMFRRGHGPALHFGKLHTAAEVYRTMYAEIPAEASFDMICEPSYWRHYTRELKAGDRLEAMSEDGSWEAAFRVMFVGAVEVRLSLLFHVKHDNIDAEDLVSGTHEVKWKGPALKFCIVHSATGQIVRDHIADKEVALAELRAYGQARA